MDWFILIFLVPLILVPIVLLCGFAGCGFEGVATGTAPAPAPAPAPPPPSNLVVTAAGTKLIKLSWEDNAGRTANFSISREEVGGKPLEIKKDVKALKAGETFDDTFTDLPPGAATEGTTFIYEVRATMVGTNDSPEAKTATTTFPATPTNLVATPVDAGRIEISWTNNSAKTKDFTVKRTALEDPGTPVAMFSVKNDTGFSDTGLTEGRKYQYEVFAEVQGFDNNVNKPVLSTPAVVSQRTWKTAYNIALTQNDGGWQNDCLVQRINAARLAAGTNGTKVKITLRGSTNAPIVIDKVTISHAAIVGNPWDSDALPKPMFKGGSATITIPANSPPETGTLDPIDFTLQPGKDLIIAFDISATAGAARKITGLPGPTFFSKNNTDAAGLDIRPGPYINQGNTVFLVEKIEVVLAL